jgi:hypothetical protein
VEAHRARPDAAARAVSPGPPRSAAAYQYALTAGFDRAFLVAAAICVLMLVVAVTVVRGRRADLAVPTWISSGGSPDSEANNGDARGVTGGR